MNKTCDTFNLCNEKKHTWLVKNGCTIVECDKCGHRFTQVVADVENHVKEIYSDDYFFGGKQGYPNYLDEKDILFKYGINYSKLLSKYRKPGKVLDVGCAAGFILKGFEQSGWTCKGVEPSDTMAAYGRKELKLDITTGSLESFQSTEKFNLVSMIQVIGHFVDPDKAIKNTYNLLDQDGFVLVESWDMKSTMAKMMGKNWHEVSPPSVINWFSDKTLEQLFNYHGFKLISKGRPSKKININHGLSLFDESTPNFLFKKGIVKFFSRIIGKYNVNYPPLDVKWYLFQKS